MGCGKNGKHKAGTRTTKVKKKPSVKVKSKKTKVRSKK